MLKKIDPTTTSAWKALSDHYLEMQSVHMQTLFEKDPRRFEKFSLYHNDILVDFSKNRITRKTLDLLIQLATKCDLKGAIDSMFKGDKINRTEKRAVLHVALRNRSNEDRDWGRPMP